MALSSGPLEMEIEDRVPLTRLHLRKKSPRLRANDDSRPELGPTRRPLREKKPGL